MIKKIVLPPMKLLIFLAGIIVISYFVFAQFDHQKNGVANESAGTVKMNASVVHSAADTEQRPIEVGIPAKANTNLTNVSNILMVTTYRPGVQRSRRQVADTMENMVYNSKKSWWLYAQSDKDAQWLDQYGYPTPEEHERLTNASDAELDNLVKNGDLNAKSHQAIRAASKAYTTGDYNDLIKAHETLYTTIRAGGPYQAVMFARSFMDLARKFQRLPPEEQTDEKRKVIQRFGEIQQEASFLTGLYNDELGTRAARVLSNEKKSEYLGLKPQAELSAVSAASMMADHARWREYNGLPPITILARPVAANNNNNEIIVIERY
jgi:hypothetical protein